MWSWYKKPETIEDLSAKRDQIETKIDQEIRSRKREVENAKMKLEDRLFEIEEELRDFNPYLSTRSTEDRESFRRARRQEDEAINQYNREAETIILKSAPLIRELNEVNRQISQRENSPNVLDYSKQYIGNLARREKIIFDVPVRNPPPIEPEPHVRFEREAFENAIRYPRKIYSGLFGQNPPPRS